MLKNLSIGQIAKAIVVLFIFVSAMVESSVFFVTF